MEDEIMLPPMNREAEEAVLGSLLIDPEAIYQVTDILKAKDFHLQGNRYIYEACLSLSRKGDSINQISVGQELERQGRLAEVGGAAILSYLIANTPTSVMIDSYASIVAELSVRRRLISLGGQIAALGFEGNGTTKEMLTKALGMLLELRPPSRRFLVRPKERADIALKSYAERQDSKGEGLPFYFADIDKRIGGMQAGELVIVGARPGIGKSTFLQQVALENAEKGAVVLFCSDEMTVKQFNDREIAIRSGIGVRHLIAGKYNDDEWKKIASGVAEIYNLPLYFLGGMSLTTADIEAKGKEVQVEAGLDLLVVDYIQLLGDKHGANDNERVGNISQRLKQIAVDLNVPLLAASQLNREVEYREDKRPRLSDLRSSGSLEQDADMVLFMHREDAYTSEAAWKASKVTQGKPYPGNIIEIGIAKHRQFGITNEVIKLVWLGNKRKYGDCSKGG